MYVSARRRSTRETTNLAVERKDHRKGKGVKGILGGKERKTLDVEEKGGRKSNIIIFEAN